MLAGVGLEVGIVEILSVVCEFSKVWLRDGGSRLAVTVT
jgi:hypothetical protein